MGELVLIDTAKRQKLSGLQALWQKYKDAKTKAETSGDINDGIAAGKAWAAWLAVFEGRAS